MTDDAKLASCPFCGGEGRLVSQRIANESGYCVECWSCTAGGPHGWTEPAAIAAWNRRVPAELTDAQAREVLR